MGLSQSKEDTKKILVNVLSEQWIKNPDHWSKQSKCEICPKRTPHDHHCRHCGKSICKRHTEYYDDIKMDDSQIHQINKIKICSECEYHFVHTWSITDNFEQSKEDLWHTIKSENICNRLGILVIKITNEQTLRKMNQFLFPILNHTHLSEITPNPNDEGSNDVNHNNNSSGSGSNTPRLKQVSFKTIQARSKLISAISDEKEIDDDEIENVHYDNFEANFHRPMPETTDEWYKMIKYWHMRSRQYCLRIEYNIAQTLDKNNSNNNRRNRNNNRKKNKNNKNRNNNTMQTPKARTRPNTPGIKGLGRHGKNGSGTSFSLHRSRSSSGSTSSSSSSSCSSDNSYGGGYHRGINVRYLMSFLNYIGTIFSNTKQVILYPYVVEQLFFECKKMNIMPITERYYIGDSKKMSEYAQILNLETILKAEENYQEYIKSTGYSPRIQTLNPIVENFETDNDDDENNDENSNENETKKEEKLDEKHSDKNDEKHDEKETEKEQEKEKEKENVTEKETKQENSSNIKNKEDNSDTLKCFKKHFGISLMTLNDEIMQRHDSGQPGENDEDESKDETKNMDTESGAQNSTSGAPGTAPNTIMESLKQLTLQTSTGSVTESNSVSNAELNNNNKDKNRYPQLQRVTPLTPTGMPSMSIPSGNGKTGKNGKNGTIQVIRNAENGFTTTSGFNINSTTSPQMTPGSPSLSDPRSPRTPRTPLAASPHVAFVATNHTTLLPRKLRVLYTRALKKAFPNLKVLNSNIIDTNGHLQEAIKVLTKVENINSGNNNSGGSAVSAVSTPRSLSRTPRIRTSGLISTPRGGSKSVKFTSTKTPILKKTLSATLGSSLDYDYEKNTQNKIQFITSKNDKRKKKHKHKHTSKKIKRGVSMAYSSRRNGKYAGHDSIGNNGDNETPQRSQSAVWNGGNSTKNKQYSFSGISTMSIGENESYNDDMSMGMGISDGVINFDEFNNYMKIRFPKSKMQEFLGKYENKSIPIEFIPYFCNFDIDQLPYIFQHWRRYFDFVIRSNNYQALYAICVYDKICQNNLNHTQSNEFLTNAKDYELLWQIIKSINDNDMIEAINHFIYDNVRQLRMLGDNLGNSRNYSRIKSGNSSSDDSYEYNYNNNYYSKNGTSGNYNYSNNNNSEQSHIDAINHINNIKNDSDYQTRLSKQINDHNDRMIMSAKRRRRTISTKQESLMAPNTNEWIVNVGTRIDFMNDIIIKNSNSIAICLLFLNEFGHLMGHFKNGIVNVDPTNELLIKSNFHIWSRIIRLAFAAEMKEHSVLQYNIGHVSYTGEIVDDSFYRNQSELTRIANEFEESGKLPETINIYRQSMIHHVKVKQSIDILSLHG